MFSATTGGGGGATARAGAEAATGARAGAERDEGQDGERQAPHAVSLSRYCGFLQYPFGLQPIGQFGFMSLASH